MTRGPFTPNPEHPMRASYDDTPRDTDPPEYEPRPMPPLFPVRLRDEEDDDPRLSVSPRPFRETTDGPGCGMFCLTAIVLAAGVVAAAVVLGGLFRVFRYAAGF